MARLLLFVLLSAAQAQPAKQEWQEAFNAAMVKVDSQDFWTAERVLKRAHGFAARIGPESREMALTLNALAAVCQHVGRPVQAERYYLQALSVYEGASETEGKALATVSNNLARLYLENGRTADAEKLLRRALAARHGAADHPDLELVRTYEYLFIATYARKDYQAARSVSGRTLEFCRQVFGPEHPETALALNDRGVLDIGLGQSTEAIAYLTEALAIMERAHGRGHPGTVRILGNLGWAYYRAGETGRAELLLGEAVQSADAAFGAEDIQTAALLYKYAVVLRKLRRKPEARRFRKRSDEIFAKSPRLSPMDLTINYGHR